MRTFGARLDVFKSDVAARTKPGIRERVRGCRNDPSKSVPRGRIALPAEATPLNRSYYGQNFRSRQCSVAGLYSPSELDAEAGQNTQFRAIVSVSHHAVEVPKRSGCGIKCNFIAAAQSFSPEESSAKVGGCELSTDLACVQTHQPLLRLRAAWLETIALSAEDYSFR
jgi:hypothetical protein